MDTKERNLQLLGAFGIVGEAFKIVHSQPKLLGTIALGLILPSVFITFINALMAPLLLSVIYSQELPELWSITEFSALELVWEVLFFVALMPSIAAVLYTVAGVYKGEQGNSILAVLRPVPTVSKRMVITCLWYFIINFVIIVGFTFVLWLALMAQIAIMFYVAVLIVVLLFVGVSMYVRMVWQVATMVSVMEGYYGWEGMKKSRRLIHGKRTAAWALTISYMVIVGLFNFGAAVGNFYFVGLGAKILYGLAYMVLACVITLMWEVTQSVLYFVCKSHHGESVDEGFSLEGYPEKTSNKEWLKLEP